jgi:hypothetical protein
MTTGCSYHPEETKVSQGMHRCPECGCHCIAGMPHPCSPMEEFAPVDIMTFDQGRPREDTRT